MEGSLPEDLHDGYYLLGLVVIQPDVDDCPHEVLADLVVVEFGDGFVSALARRLSFVLLGEWLGERVWYLSVEWI